VEFRTDCWYGRLDGGYASTGHVSVCALSELHLQGPGRGAAAVGDELEEVGTAPMMGFFDELLLLLFFCFHFPGDFSHFFCSNGINLFTLRYPTLSLALACQHISVIAVNGFNVIVIISRSIQTQTSKFESSCNNNKDKFPLKA
jgi:hypothetical protein